MSKSLVSAAALFAFTLPLSIVGCNKDSPSSSTSGSSWPASASVDAPAGYNVAFSSDTGKSLTTKKTNVATVQAALMATFPDLATYFGNRPNIGSAYQDAHDSTTGGATFGASYKGQPVRGIVSCKLRDGSATVAVIFGRTDAPKAEWEKLMNPPAQPASASTPAPANPLAAAPDQGIPLKEYDFPDGTGSVGLAGGWTSQGQSVVDPIAISGPADQSIVLHNGTNISTPDSMAVRQRKQLVDMQAQNAAGFARMGIKAQPPKPLPPLLVAPFTDPVTAFQALCPQFSKRSEFNNGPTLSLIKINSSQDLPAQGPNAKRSLIDYTFTRTLKGESKGFRAQIVVVMAPIQVAGNDTWMWLVQSSMQSPQESFDHDLPIMMAMVNSQKVNADRAAQVVNARGQAMAQAGQQMAAAAAAQQDASFHQFQHDQQTRQNIHDQQMAETQRGYDAHNAQFNNYELQRSRNAADFNESIIGTRTIYDTVTGQSGYANLTDVNGVVDSLNQAALDPNRFVQIPLRDQLYPLPPAK